MSADSRRRGGERYWREERRPGATGRAGGRRLALAEARWRPVPVRRSAIARRLRRPPSARRRRCAGPAPARPARRSRPAREHVVPRARATSPAVGARPAGRGSSSCQSPPAGVQPGDAARQLSQAGAGCSWPSWRSFFTEPLGAGVSTAEVWRARRGPRATAECEGPASVPGRGLSSENRAASASPDIFGRSGLRVAGCATTPATWATPAPKQLPGGPLDPVEGARGPARCARGGPWSLDARPGAARSLRLPASGTAPEAASALLSAWRRRWEGTQASVVTWGGGLEGRKCRARERTATTESLGLT
ncbi:translation initiation factor IF-2-like [Elephas maximus indicus]|uniref:translation initiation factor IF-2-like n=1 Tax=Elephas maximus indicus TaxID=99487 RepID=UPI0021162AB5|nr:translation initiation factor IF-2-like [Elephas maximus indicus]